MRRALVAGALLLAARTANAQPTDVPAQIKLIENQPTDMDRVVWKEKRRDAAKKLAQSKDKRAVPELMKLAENETFDIIGEIAIEGLGALGDPSAVPTLQKIIADPARDKGQKELAKKALAKLGGATAAPPPANPPPSGGNTGVIGTGDLGDTTPPPKPDTPATPAKPSGATSGAAAVLGTGPVKSDSELPALPELPDDTLAAYDRVTFAGGTANFGYDTVRKRTDFDADVSGLYQRRIERESMAWGWDAGAHVVAGYINPPGDAVSRGAEVDVNADGEARFYSGQIYGIGRAAAAAQFQYVSDTDPNNPGNSLKDTRFTADLQIALGGGYGRLLDVGGAIRIRRLSRTLDAARALGKPIDAATEKKLELTWWALRGDRSSYRALVETVAILREAGILLGEPDAGLTYEILNVLRDSQLYQRPSGFDVNLQVGEGYLQREDNPNPQEEGRVEQLLASAGYGAQLDDDKVEISGTAYGRLRLFADDNVPSPWAAGATARFRKFAYGDHGDPVGVFDLAGAVQISNDDLMTSQFGQRISGELGFTWWLNQASGFRLAGQVAEDRGALFIGAQLQASYGLLDGTFAR